ncbi:hypothetical protein AGMMS50267_17830 [Spirochaetia bacterium]|nr:hypothetical protein AGMMS50267_17830 [Spirochaetia bacterium]
MKKKFAGLLMFIGLCAAVSAQNTAEADFNVALTADGTGVVIEKYTGKGGVITIPATIEGMPVREIGEGAFAYKEEYAYNYSINTNITAVTFPAGLVKIGADAFAYCAGLSSVVIPDSVTEIGEGAFRGCYQRPDTRARPPKPATGLTSVTLPKGLAKAGGGGNEAPDNSGGIFYECLLLKTVTIPEGVQVIGDNMFAGCEALTTIVIPNSVTSLGRYAFRGSGLVSFTLGNGITLIPLGAFKDCTNLQTVVIPEGIVKIDGGRGFSYIESGGSFSGCTALTSVTLPSTIKMLGACRAFQSGYVPFRVTGKFVAELPGEKAYNPFFPG